MLNIHPSLLPSFPGLDPHGQALRAGVKISGATVHFVIPETDAGPIIAQARCPCATTTNVEHLCGSRPCAEHRVYPLAPCSPRGPEDQIVGARCLIEGD
jgi:phosphoribosylglycinamide formyltransferase-1